MKLELFKEYLEVADFLGANKEKLAPMGEALSEAVPFLYAAVHVVKSKEEQALDEKHGFCVEHYDDNFIFRKGSTGFILDGNNMYQLLVDLIGIFEDVLPLGSVVELKKEQLTGIDQEKIKDLKIVITKRFLAGEKGCYYPYGGLIYPLGTVGHGQQLSFTPSLIDKVVFKGYSDDVEEEFVYGMKKILIIEQRRKSVGFATKEELAETNESMRQAALRTMPI